MTRHTTRVAVLAGILILVGFPATSAQVPTIAQGTRVRVEAWQPSTKVEGWLMSQTGDSVGIATGNAMRMIPSEAITTLRVFGGRSHARGAIRGMKVGTVVVGGGFGLVFVTAFVTYDGEKDVSTLWPWIASSAITGAMFGAAIGAAIGAEKWNTIYSNPVRIAVRPLKSGAAGIGLSMKF